MRKLTIMVSDDFYADIRKRIGQRGIGRFLERVAAPHLAPLDLDREYRDMAADQEREIEARLWTEAELRHPIPEEDWDWLRHEAG